MFKTADGEILDLAPWRMRRLMRLVADARSYPPGTPPQMLVNDLRQIVARARRVSTQPRLGTARFESRGEGACCQACLLARQQQGVLSLVGLSLSPMPSPGHLSEAFDEELTHLRPKLAPPPVSLDIELKWRRWSSLEDASRGVAGPGVYIFSDGAVPTYIGHSNALEARLRQWFQYQRALTCVGPKFIWTAPTRKNPVAAAIEHTLLSWVDRKLRLNGRLRSGMPSMLANRVLTNLVTVGEKDLVIRNAMPPELAKDFRPTANTMHIKAGTQFEVPFDAYAAP